MVMLTAPAKVTLSLRIVGVRHDGYHLIDAEMVTVDLHDSLELEACEPPSRLTIVTDPGPTASGAATARDHTMIAVSADADNLVLRALALAERSASVRLHKRIPAGAGLGGGSADAAAVLRWAGQTDPAQAVSVGADVPFCVVGGRARVGGIGEQVEPVAHQPLVLTLATPPFGCSTPEVYAAWDALGGPTVDGPNDLEPAALVVRPELAAWRDSLGEATGQTPVLAGSGSTWFVYGDYPGPGRTVVHAVDAGWNPHSTPG